MARQSESSYKITVDTGGTFTDCVLTADSEIVGVGKALTRYDALEVSILESIEDAAAVFQVSLGEVLEGCDRVVFGTTHAINALTTKTTAKTALITTGGFPDTLLFREGGRSDELLFEYNVEYPPPFVPRRYTFEIDERISSEGDVLKAADPDDVRAVLARVADLDFEAVAVCLLWSVVNPAHELLVGEIAAEMLPGVPVSLSHQVLPIVREYRRASATAIDASLKPLIHRTLGQLDRHFAEAGYTGPLLVATSMGGCIPLADALAAPIALVKSGPAMAPVAGQAYSRAEDLTESAVVVDTGGTTFDISLIRDSELVFTRDTWVGGLGTGHILAKSSIDVRSIGSGGGSIAWVDSGGLLHVGPQSAGAEPGPACYARGGTLPTVTDAAVVLGYIAPEHFFGGKMKLDSEAAHRAIGDVADQLGMSIHEAALGVVKLSSETMVNAIHEMTLRVGIDPRDNVIVAGGGAAGLNIVAIARELGVAEVLVPRNAGVLSAVGMQHADLVVDASTSLLVSTDKFDAAGVTKVVQGLDDQLKSFRSTVPTSLDLSWEVEHWCEARYAGQVWELAFQLPSSSFQGDDDVQALRVAFDRAHQDMFTFHLADYAVDCINWTARLRGVHATIRERVPESSSGEGGFERRQRTLVFAEGEVDATVFEEHELVPGMLVAGPAIVESGSSTLVLPPEASFRVTDAGNFRVSPFASTGQASRVARPQAEGVSK